eukprot:4429219-Heterocapsa_arctica.AAC.1
MILMIILTTVNSMLGTKDFLEDNCDQRMQECQNIVKAVVDSENMLSNIPHDTLHSNTILCVLKKNFVNKYVQMFVNILENNDDYKKLYEQFGNYLKLGVLDDFMNYAKMAKLFCLCKLKLDDERIISKKYLDQNIIYD